MQYKKILSTAGIVLGIVFLAGCGTKNPVTPAPQPVPAPTTVPVPTSIPATRDNSASSSPAQVLPNPNTPATSQDVDKGLQQVDSDLNAIDANTPDPNDINSTDLQK